MSMASSQSSAASSSSAGLPAPLADILEQFRDKLMEQRDLGSKATINALSMIAGDVRNGPLPPLLVRAVIDRATHLTSASQRLPLLYLLDSIIKNVKAPYIELFSHHVGSLFTSTYEIAPEPVRLTLLKLLKFWEQPAPLFASHVLDQCRRAVARATAAPVAGVDAKKRALDMGAAGGMDKKLRSLPPPPPGDMMYARHHGTHHHGHGPHGMMTNTWPQQQYGIAMDMNHGMGMSGGGGPGWGQGNRAAVPPVNATMAGPLNDTQRAAAAQLEHVFSQLEAELSNRPDLRPMLADIRIAVAQGKPMGQAIEQLTRALAEPANSNALRAAPLPLPLPVPVPVPVAAVAVPMTPLRGSSPPRIPLPSHIPHHPIPSPVPLPLPSSSSSSYRPIPPPNPLPPPSHMMNSGSRGGASAPLLPLPSSVSVSMTPPYAREASFEQEYLKTRDDHVIYSLYEGINTALQCKTCGMRQPDSKAMGRHLDWHFSMNKRDARNIKQTPSRAWFMTPAQWILTEDAMVDIIVPASVVDNDAPPTAPVASTLIASRNIPVDESQKNCAICNEAFEQYLDDDEGIWMYRSVVRLPRTGAGAGLAISHGHGDGHQNEASLQEAERLRNAITLPYIKPYNDRLVHALCLEGLLLQAPSNTILPPSPSIRPAPLVATSTGSVGATSASVAVVSSSPTNGVSSIPSLASFKPRFTSAAPAPAPAVVAAVTAPSSSPLALPLPVTSSDTLMSVVSPANSGRRLDIRSNDDHDTNGNGHNDDTHTNDSGNTNSNDGPPPLEPSSTSSQTVIPVLLSSFQPKCVCPSPDIRSMNCRIHLPPDSPSIGASPSSSSMPPLTMPSTTPLPLPASSSSIPAAVVHVADPL